jgi:hypothetical protein
MLDQKWGNCPVLITAAVSYFILFSGTSGAAMQQSPN